MNEAGERRALKLQVDAVVLVAPELDGCKGSEVREQHAREQLLEVGALGGGDDALDLGGEHVLLPLGNASQQVLKRHENLVGLAVLFANEPGILVDTLDAVEDVGNDHQRKTIANVPLGELGLFLERCCAAHLFRDRCILVVH